MGGLVRGASMFLGIAVLLQGLVVEHCMATTWHVSPKGDDKNPGTGEAPFATLQRAETAVAPGDEVVLGDGTYHLGRMGLIVQKSGLPDKPITVRAQNPGRVILMNYEEAKGFERYKGNLWRTRLDRSPTMACEDGDPLHHRWEHKFDGPDDPRIQRGFWQWFDGYFYVWPWEDDDPNAHRLTVSFNSIITITGTCCHRTWEGLVFEHCYYGMKWDSPQARHHVVRNCLFKNGCEGLGGANDTLIEHCTFYNLGPSKWEHGIYDGCENTVIRYNHFEKIAGGALHLYRMPRAITACYNTIGPPMTKRVSFPGQVGIYAWGRGGHQIHHNLIYGGHRIGISVNAPDCAISNNTVVGTTMWGIAVYKGQPGNSVTNNIVMGAGGLLGLFQTAPKLLDQNVYAGEGKWSWLDHEIPTLEKLRQASGMEAHSVVTVKPLFVNPDGLDFRLRTDWQSPNAGAFEDGKAWPERPGVSFEWRKSVTDLHAR